MRIYRNYYLLLILFVASIAVGNCGKKNPVQGTTANKLTGKLFLDGEKDYSGIIVEIYNFVKRDSIWDAARGNYPFIGIEQTQAMIFDHRDNEPLLSTTTNMNGEFQITGFDEGSYNLVFRKDGFGWRYLCNVVLGKGEIPLQGLFSDSLKLWKEKSLNNNNSGNTFLLEHHHYIVEKDLKFDTGSRIEIEAGVWIRLNSDVSIEINGHVKSSASADNPIKITANDANHSSKLFGSIKIGETSTGDFNYVHLSLAQNGIELNSEKFKLNYVYISECQRSIGINADQDITNGVIRNSADGMRLSNSATVNVENWLLLNCSVRAIDCVSKFSTIKNNYFSKNGIGIELGGKSYNKVSNNYFAGNSIAVKLVQAFPSISQNTFENSITIFHISDLGKDILPAIEKCNFVNVRDWFFYTKGLLTDITAKNNYWNRETISEINSQIWDGNDYSIGSSKTGIIYFQPIASSPIINAYPTE